MTEDSGAFKTNPANSGPISAQATARGPCGHRAARPENAFLAALIAFAASIFNKRKQAVAVFSNQPDSRAPVLCAASRTRPVLWSPRSRWLKGLRKISNRDIPKAEFASMLPGFRFLFAAIVLSLSILVFGLGAAALLRAAHEEFASTPAWRGAPEMVFAQPVETTRPVLALLRVDTPVVEKAADTTPSDAVPAAITAAPSEPERIAALKPEDSPSLETAKPEAKVAESPAQGEAASAPAELAVAIAETKSAETKTGETKIAMSEDSASPANQSAAPAASEPAALPTSPDATIAATKIATLGGPAVSIETPRPVKAEGKKTDSAKADSTKTDSAKTGSNIIKKRQHARRAARRRLAARARLTAQLPLQQADPFGQPAPTIVRRR
jgi:hypothetical protein